MFLCARIVRIGWLQGRKESKYARSVLRRDMVLTIDQFYNTRMAVMASDSRFQSNQLFRALLERIQNDVDILVEHMSTRATALREEMEHEKEFGFEDDIEAAEEDRKRRQEEGDRPVTEEELAPPDMDRIKEDLVAELGSKLHPELIVVPIKTLVPPSVPAATATVMRAQLPAAIDQMMSVMKEQIGDVHRQVLTLHARIDRLESQLGETRTLVHASQLGH